MHSTRQAGTVNGPAIGGKKSPLMKTIKKYLPEIFFYGIILIGGAYIVIGGYINIFR